MLETDEILYPDSDGLPIAENTVQFRWIAIVMWNADALFRDRADVFVAGDHLIYPVEGSPQIRSAPDVYVAFGPAKHDRGSYRVWREGGVFPQVVFEVWSPGNRRADAEFKLAFYDRYGAEEYYLIDPDGPEAIHGWRRVDGRLEPIAAMNGFVSPRLGFRFRTADGGIGIDGPDGRELLDPRETARRRDAAELRADEEHFQGELARAREQRQREKAAAQTARADDEKARADDEKARADDEKLAKDAALEEAERLRAKLRALGVDPDQGS